MLFDEEGTVVAKNLDAALRKLDEADKEGSKKSLNNAEFDADVCTFVSMCSRDRLAWIEALEARGVRMHHYGRCNRNVHAIPGASRTASGWRYHRQSTDQGRNRAAVSEKEGVGYTKAFREKIGAMAGYRLAIVFESHDAPDYVSEKIFHALAADTVPVYKGAPNIVEFLPCDECAVVLADPAAQKEEATSGAAGKGKFSEHDADNATAQLGNAADAFAAELRRTSTDRLSFLRRMAWRTRSESFLVANASWFGNGSMPVVPSGAGMWARAQLVAARGGPTRSARPGLVGLSTADKTILRALAEGTLDVDWRAYNSDEESDPWDDHGEAKARGGRRESLARRVLALIDTLERPPAEVRGPFRRQVQRCERAQQFQQGCMACERVKWMQRHGAPSMRSPRAVPPSLE
jgi:hypothetical protein